MNDLSELKELIAEYQELINVTLPSIYKSPVRYNHCFNRIILDWLFGDCWYNFLDTKKTAISQLSKDQINSAIVRMKEWLQHHELLILDNNNSLNYRKQFKKKSQPAKDCS